MFLLEAIAFLREAIAFLGEAIAFLREAIAFLREAIIFFLEAIAFLRGEIYGRGVMNEARSTAPTPGESPVLPLDPLVEAIGDPLRMRILAVMATGERLMVLEIARRLGRPANLIAKHVAVLRRAGVVETRQRLQYVPQRFVADAGARTLDFGVCVLRLAGLERE